MTHYLDQERAITSVHSVYVPADDPTDPTSPNPFARLDAFIYLECSIVAKGITRPWTRSRSRGALSSSSHSSSPEQFTGN